MIKKPFSKLSLTPILYPAYQSAFKADDRMEFRCSADGGTEAGTGEWPASNHWGQAEYTLNATVQAAANNCLYL